MKKIILFIFIFSNLVFSTPLFIEETPIKTYIKNKILKEAEEKGDIKTIYELTNENKLVVTNIDSPSNSNDLIMTNSSALIITNDIDFSKYKERGYDITMDVLPRYYTVVKGDTLFKIS